MVDGRMKLGPRGGCRQTREQLENLALIARSGGRDMALLEHPRRGLEREDRVLRQVLDGRPLLEGAAAHDRAGRTDFQGLDRFRRPLRPILRDGFRRGPTLSSFGELHGGVHDYWHARSLGLRGTHRGVG